MKILHCIATLECGGAERQLSYIAPELARRGHEIHVAYLRGGLNLERLENGLVKLHRLRGHSNYDPRIFFDLLRLIRKLKPDLIQTWLLQMDILAGIAANMYNIPWVLREPATQKSWKQTVLKPKITVRKCLGLTATGIIANSRGGIEYWKSFRKKDLMFVITNALPLEEIVRAEPAKVSDLGINPMEKIILYVGKLDDKVKNVLTLMRALLRVVKKGKIRAILCGDGPDRYRIENMVRTYGLQERIFLPGVISNVWAWMKMTDVFVSVSHYEGRPNTVLEAMACGCPVVVSDIPAHREFLDNSSALFADPLNAEEIADAINLTLSSPDDAASRGQNAKQAVLNWTIDNITEQYINAYRAVIDRS